MLSEERSTTFKEYLIEEYFIEEEPFYISMRDEVQIFEAPYALQEADLLSV